MTAVPVAASFRDPSGFLFRRDGVLYRHVAPAYGEHYDRLYASGLYAELTESALLVPHTEDSPHHSPVAGAYRVLRPEPIPFVSYPYEWTFGQLRAAALLTLDIQRRALDRGMTLKDASAFNVQFRGSRPVFIDTLSFAPYREGAPWVAYRQFCQHFLAPLLLMCRVDERLGGLSRQYLDGVPLDLASAILPRRSWLRAGSLLHVHLHARALRRYEGDPAATDRKGRSMPRTALLGLVDSLERATASLTWTPAGTEWAEYATTHSYAADALADKRALVREWIGDVAGRTVWDLGANVGVFSRIAADAGARVVAFDLDPAAVERHWRALSARTDDRTLPLLLDLTNPTPALGWASEERQSLAERGPADVILALALVHHLAISHNVPLDRIARYFASLGARLVIEFVPKSDAMVQRLLASREDIFPDYTRAGFEAAFGRHFRIGDSRALSGSERWLYRMERLG